MATGFEQCPKCASTKTLSPLHLFEDSSNYNSSFDTVKIGFYKRPDAWVLKEKQMENFHACACLDCGYLEFYLSNPEALLPPES